MVVEQGRPLHFRLSTSIFDSEISLTIIKSLAEASQAVTKAILHSAQSESLCTAYHQINLIKVNEGKARTTPLFN
jgi:hypothetical protein